MNENIKVLKEVCKGVKMGMDSISYIADKVENDDNFRKALNHEYSVYNNISNQVNNAYAKYCEDPGDTSIKDKAMLWYRNTNEYS